MSTAMMQTAIVALIVLAAAAYLGRALWRTISSARRAKAGAECAAGCGCAATPPAQLQSRAASHRPHPSADASAAHTTRR